MPIEKFAETYGAILVFLLIILLIMAWNQLILVPAGCVVVTRGWNNQIVRVLKEGFHVLPPWEQSMKFSWTFTDQNYDTEHVSGSQIRVAGVQQMDMVPIECETGDNVTASVDTLLVWRVQDPQKAMSVSHDPLNLLCQQVIRCIRRETVKYTRKLLARHEEEVAAAACATIAKEWTPVYGLEIVKCEIQNISYDEDTIRRRRQFRDGLDEHQRSRIEQAHALATGTEKRTRINL